MPATPDRPVPPKLAAGFGLRGLRDRFRRHVPGSSPDQTSPSASDWPTPLADTYSHFPASPAIEPPTPSNATFAVGAPPPPAVRPGWAHLPTPALRQDASPYSPPSPKAKIHGGNQLRQLPLVFAVDVSGSTRGTIIDQEKQAIAHLVSRLNPPGLESKSYIIPWDGRCLGLLHPQQVRSLVPGAGTDPSVILENEVSRKALQDASIWFLMTDGYIEKPAITKFANAISKAGLHGTASVIILYGYRSRSPFECNVSVGVSVFAVAPHCIFLFHDVKRGELYVFQAKGSFTELLPEDAKFTPFGPTTEWRDLTKITYTDLSRVSVPRPTRLSQDAVVLPGGKIFDMSALYKNSVSKDETMELLADYAALDVVLLAAKTRGKEAAVKAWIEHARQQHEIPDAATLRREDVESNGISAMRQLLQETGAFLPPDHQAEDLWDTLSCTEPPTLGPHPGPTQVEAVFRLNGLRFMLRLAHERNWTNFVTRIGADLQQSHNINEAFSDVLSTITMNKDRAPSSPAMLTPMSSPSVFMDPKDYGSGVRVMHSRQEARMSPLSPSHAAANPYYVTSQAAGYPPNAYANVGFPRSGIASHFQQQSARVREFLFLPGFKGERLTAHENRAGVYLTCPICKEPKSIQTLLAQARSEDSETLNLPKPGQRAGHKYPLVLGNYPETDVILPITCCDGCAFLLLEAGELPNGDRVTAALPLVSLQIAENRKLWEDTLSKVYGDRFNLRTVILVFISTLCTTIEDLADGAIKSQCPSLRHSLEWCCKELSKLRGISTMAGFTPVGSPLSGIVNDEMPLQEAIHAAFNGIQSIAEQTSLLSYPMDGFLVLIRLAGLTDRLGPEEIERFVWLRLLYYLTEQYAKLQSQIGLDEAGEVLVKLINRAPSTEGPKSTVEVSETKMAATRRHTIALSALEGTYLIPSDSNILEQFQRTGAYFSVISNTDKYNGSLAVFLHIIFTVTGGSAPYWAVDELFAKLQYRADRLRRESSGMHDVFFEGKLVDEAVAAKLITGAYAISSNHT